MRGASGMVTILEVMENPRWLWGSPRFWLAGILQVLGIAGLEVIPRDIAFWGFPGGLREPRGEEDSRSGGGLEVIGITKVNGTLEKMGFWR